MVAASSVLLILSTFGFVVLLLPWSPVWLELLYATCVLAFIGCIVFWNVVRHRDRQSGGLSD